MPSEPVATVMLVHGLWGGGWVMQLLRERLRQAGFHCLSFSYPSTRKTLSQNAERLRAAAAQLDAPVLHWVGHSLGGVLSLHALAGMAQAPPGRVVLLAAPVRDCHAARRLAACETGRRLMGHSMLELLEARGAGALAGREIGVLAGSRSLGMGRVLAPGLPQPNDGVVGVEETVLPGATDRLVMAVSHSGMLVSGRVARQVACFLRDGRFARGADAP